MAQAGSLGSRPSWQGVGGGLPLLRARWGLAGEAPSPVFRRGSGSTKHRRDSFTRGALGASDRGSCPQAVTGLRRSEQAERTRGRGVGRGGPACPGPPCGAAAPGDLPQGGRAALQRGWVPHSALWLPALSSDFNMHGTQGERRLRGKQKQHRAAA